MGECVDPEMHDTFVSIRVCACDDAPAPSIDAAWSRCEAALPEGWTIAGVWLSGHGAGRYQAMAQGPKRSQTVSGDTNKTSPAAALDSLAARLEARR